MLYWKGKSTPGCAAADRHNRRQVRRKLLGHAPLVKSRIGSAPHGHFPVAGGLFCEPFRHVVPVAPFIREWLELAFRISASANVHQRIHVSVAREIHRPVRVRISNVWRQGEHHRQRFLLSVRPVHRRVQLHSIAQRDLHTPGHVYIPRGALRRVLRRVTRLRHPPQQRQQNKRHRYLRDATHPLSPRIVRESPNATSMRRETVWPCHATCAHECCAADPAATDRRARKRNTFLWFASSTSNR